MIPIRRLPKSALLNPCRNYTATASNNSAQLKIPEFTPKLNELINSKDPLITTIFTQSLPKVLLHSTWSTHATILPTIKELGYPSNFINFIGKDHWTVQGEFINWFINDLTVKMKLQVAGTDIEQ